MGFIIKKSGAFFRYEEQMIGQGKAATIDWLKENQDKAKEIVEKVMKMSKDGGTPMAVGMEEEEKDADATEEAANPE